MKKIILILILVLLVAGVIFLLWKQNQRKALQNEKEQFAFVEQLNAELFQKLPDSMIFQISGFTYEVKYERQEYQDIVGRQTLNKVYDAIKNQTIYDLYLKTDKFDLYMESDDYGIYTISKEPLLIKDFRVTLYIYFKGGSLTKNKLERMETVYKFEVFEKLKDQWYKVVFIENSGRNFNL